MKRLAGIVLLFVLAGCTPSAPTEIISEPTTTYDTLPRAQQDHPVIPYFVTVKRNINMQEYFTYVDSLADSTLHYLGTSLPREYLLVNANPWIIDSLRTKDYYHQKKKGKMVYDQGELILFHSGDSLLIPDSTMAAEIIHNLQHTLIDVNIPEYRLRIIQDPDTVLTCKVRVGQNRNKYMTYYQKELDLRTPVGEGEIVAVRKHPKYFDPETGEEYIETKRDDGVRTKMPAIPSLTPRINGSITGSLIHATTNPRSLGKAYSNGCIGTSEPDIWSIYYSAPPGTKVRFRYELDVKDKAGKTIHLRDIYHRDEPDSLLTQ